MGLGEGEREWSLLDGFYENQLRQIRCYKWPGQFERVELEIQQLQWASQHEKKRPAGRRNEMHHKI